jgi:hypothetical protein
MMSSPAKKARYQEELRHHDEIVSSPERGEHVDDVDAKLLSSSSSLVDLFRKRSDANHREGSSLEPRNAISSKFPNRFSCQEGWFTKSGNVCTLRIETRCDDCQNEDNDGNNSNDDDGRSEGQERILLFRSDHRGAIGKIIFSYHVGWDNGDKCGGGSDHVATRAIRAKIQVVDVKGGTSLPALQEIRLREAYLTLRSFVVAEQRTVDSIWGVCLCPLRSRSSDGDCVGAIRFVSGTLGPLLPRGVVRLARPEAEARELCPLGWMPKRTLEGTADLWRSTDGWGLT